jgi:hypothetical protein
MNDFKRILYIFNKGICLDPFKARKYERMVLGKMERPVLKYPNLCFICQEKEPTIRATRGDEAFNICSQCARAVQAESKMRNSLAENKIFSYTLGLESAIIRFEKLKELQLQKEGNK